MAKQKNNSVIANSVALPVEIDEAAVTDENVTEATPETTVPAGSAENVVKDREMINFSLPMDASAVDVAFALQEFFNNDLSNYGRHASKLLPSAEINAMNVFAILFPSSDIVDKAQLTQLITQNATMKTEIGQLVGLFKNFEGLITGKSITSLMLTLPKLINNPVISEQIALVEPIIKKYTKTP